jgi:hypothetical protein
VLSRIQNSGSWTQSRNPVIPSVIHDRQNPLDATRILRFAPNDMTGVTEAEEVNKKEYNAIDSPTAADWPPQILI